MKYQALLVAWVVHSLPVASGFSVNQNRQTTPLKLSTNFPITSSSTMYPISATAFSGTRLSSSVTSSSTQLSSSNSFLQDDILKLWTRDTRKDGIHTGRTPPPAANGQRNGANQAAATTSIQTETVQSNEKGLETATTAASTSSFESFVQNQHSWNESPATTTTTTPANANVVAAENHPSMSTEPASVTNGASAAAFLGPDTPEASHNSDKEEKSNSYTPYKVSWNSEASGSTPGSSPEENDAESGPETTKSAVLTDKTMSSGPSSSTLKSEAPKDQNKSDIRSSSGESKAVATPPAASSSTSNVTAKKSNASSFAPGKSSWKSETPKANGMGTGSTREKLGAIETSSYPAVDAESSSPTSPTTSPFAHKPSEKKIDSNKASSSDQHDFSWGDLESPGEDEDAIETSAYEAVETPANTISDDPSASTSAAQPDAPKTPIMTNGNTNKFSQSSSVEHGEQDMKSGPQMKETKTTEMSSDKNESSKVPVSSASSENIPNESNQSAMGESPSDDNNTSLVDATLYGYSSGSWRLVDRLEARKSKAASPARSKPTQNGSHLDQTDQVPFTRKPRTPKSDESVQAANGSGASKRKSFRDVYDSWKSADFKHLLGIKSDDGTIETSASEEKDSDESSPATEAPVPSPSVATSSSPAENLEESTMPSINDDFKADIDSSSGYSEAWGESTSESETLHIEAPMESFVRKPKEGFVRKPKDTSAESMSDYTREGDVEIGPESLLPGTGAFSSSRSMSDSPDAVQSDVYVTPNKGKTASTLRASSFFGNLYTSWRTVDFKEIPSGGAGAVVDTSRRQRSRAEESFPPAGFPHMDPRQQQHMPAPHMRQGGRENTFLPPQAGRMYPGPASGAIQSMQRPGFWGDPPGGGQQYYPPGFDYTDEYEPSMMETTSPGWSFDHRYASFKGPGSKKRYQTTETSSSSRNNNVNRAPDYSRDRRGDPQASRQGYQDTERSGYPPVPAEEAYYSRPSSTPPSARANQADVHGANGSNSFSSFDHRYASFRSNGRKQTQKQTQTRGMPPSGARNMDMPSYPAPPVDLYYQEDMYDGYPGGMGRNAYPESTNFDSRYASFKSTDVKNPQNSRRRNVPMEQGGEMPMGRGGPPQGPPMPGPGGWSMGRNTGISPQGPPMPGSGGMFMGRNMGAPPQGPPMPGPGGRAQGRNTGAPTQGPPMSDRSMGRNTGPQGPMPGSGGMFMGRNMGAPPQGPSMPDRSMGRNVGPQGPMPGGRPMERNMGAPPQGPQIGRNPTQMPGTGGRSTERSSRMRQGYSNERYGPSQRFGNARTQAEQHRMLMEIQQHLELLREFEGTIPPQEMERRKRELFLSMPPPLANDFDSLNTPPDDMRRSPSRSSFSSRYNSYRSSPYDRPY